MLPDNQRRALAKRGLPPSLSPNRSREIGDEREKEQPEHREDRPEEEHLHDGAGGVRAHELRQEREEEERDLWVEDVRCNALKKVLPGPLVCLVSPEIAKRSLLESVFIPR